MSKEAPRSVNDQESARNKLRRWFIKPRTGAPHAKVEIAVARRDAKNGSRPAKVTPDNKKR